MSPFAHVAQLGSPVREAGVPQLSCQPRSVMLKTA